MRMVNEAEAFGGRWGTSVLAWVILLAPTTLLVVIQDIRTPFSSPLLLIASALAQHALAGGTVIAVGTFIRRTRPIIPVVPIFALWIFAGAV